MDYKYIEQLLEHYWQCETSLEEEKILRAFFSQKDIPAELLKYRELFAYQATECKEDVLGDDFDEKILEMIDEPKTVKAREIKMTNRLMPLFKAAAVIAIFLTLGNAMQRSMGGSTSEENVGTVTAQDKSKDTLFLMSEGAQPVRMDSAEMANPTKAEVDSMLRNINSEQVKY